MPGDRAPRWLAAAWLAVVVVALLYNGYVWGVQRRTPETDFLALLPQGENDPAVARAVSRVADAAQQYVVVLAGSTDWSQARAAGAAFTKIINRHPDWFNSGAAAALNQDSALAPWWAHRSALLTAADRRALQTNAPDAWARSAMQNLLSPLGTGRIGAWQDDPFGLFRNWLQERGGETPVRPTDGVLRVDDGDLHYVVLPVRLRGQAFSFLAQRAMAPILDSAMLAARQSAPGVKVMAAGIVLPAADAARQADQEMSTIGLGSLIGIVLMTWLALQSLRPIGLVLMSIGVGTVGALAVTALLFAKVHLITLVFGAGLVGVAADYGLSFLSNRGRVDRSSWTVMCESLPGLALSVATTVVAFLGLALTPFPGLQQMAVFAAVGLIFAWVTVVVWFPVLDRAPGDESRLASWFGGTRAHWPTLQFNRRTGIAAAGVAAIIGIGIARLTPNDDIRLLQNLPPGMMEEQSEVGRILQIASVAQFYVVRAESETALLAREETLRAQLDSLATTGALTGYHAVSAWVPSQAAQARDQQLVRERLYQPRGALDQLRTALGESPSWGRSLTKASATAPLTVSDWLGSPVSEPLRHLWLGPTSGEWASVIAPKGIDYDKLAALRGAAAATPGVTWTDKVAEISALLGRYRSRMAWVIGLSYAVIWLVLLPRYGKRAWRVLAPSVVASLASLAVFGWLGLPLQLFHVLALLIIFGSGVDYAIFLMERPLAADTWLGVGLAAVSTLLSFGLLALSSTPLLRAFGSTMLLGITISVLSAPYFCTGRDAARTAPAA